MSLRVVICILLFSCSIMMCRKNGKDNSPSVCGVKDPLARLSWLNAKLDEYRTQRLNGVVRSYVSGGETIISIQAYIQSCYPCGLYTCNGRELDAGRDSTIIQDVMENLNDMKVIGEF